MIVSMFSFHSRVHGTASLMAQHLTVVLDPHQEDLRCACGDRVGSVQKAQNILETVDVPICSFH